MGRKTGSFSQSLYSPSSSEANGTLPSPAGPARGQYAPGLGEGLLAVRCLGQVVQRAEQQHRVL
jgi:hypothetical protein